MKRTNTEKAVETKAVPNWLVPGALAATLIGLNYWDRNFNTAAETANDEFIMISMYGMLGIMLIVSLFFGYFRRRYFSPEGLIYRYCGIISKTVKWEDIQQALVLIGSKGATSIVFVPKDCPTFDPESPHLSGLYLNTHILALIQMDVTEENIHNTRKYFRDFDYKAPITMFKPKNY